MISEMFERVVFIELAGEKQPVPAGLFTLDTDIGVGSFVYGRRYLERSNSIALDPVNLPLADSEYRTTRNNGIFGVLADVLPDSWGRFILAKERNVPFGTLKEHELVDLASTQAVGALTFGHTPERPETKTEKTVTLEELGEVAAAFDRAVEEEALSADILYLLRQGTSLGGAQPKCPVSIDGEAWIAKFESSKTLVRYPAIEFTTMNLAGRAGITIPEIRLENIAGRQVYLVKRFDRQNGRRLPFLSGFALSDLDLDTLERGSYPEIATRMRKFIEHVKDQLHELYRRMVFNVFVRNEDDHLRNHGFIYRKGWSLSPAYDILPMPARRQNARPFHLALQIGDHGSQATIDNLLTSHEQFGLSRPEAIDIIKQVSDTIRDWEKLMQKNGVQPGDIASISWCFEGVRRQYEDMGL